MRLFSCFLICAATLVLCTGCGTAVSAQWRNDALQRFNTALSAGAEVFAPEETDNIRRTILLADRYHRSEMIADADRLYRLSSQKCQLLYRNIILSKVADGATISLESEPGKQPELIEIARGHISLEAVLKAEETAIVATSREQSFSGVSDTTHLGTDMFTQAPTDTSASAHNLKKNPVSANTKVRRTRPDKAIIYLTFDDGPSRLTLPIARFLKSEGVPATFFVLGSNIKGREKALTATLAMGHTIGNHTLSHNLKKLRTSFGKESSEIKQTGDMIERLGGDGRMVRIPYGASGKSIVSQVAAEGVQIFEWDIDSNDSTQRGVRDHLFIEKSVLRQLHVSAKKHVILLFHDGAGHDSTLTALRDLIPRLKQEGYRFGLLARSEKVAHSTENRQAVQ